MKELQEERTKASDEFRKNLRRNTLGEVHRKLGGSVELQVLAVAWGRGLVPDFHQELWTPGKIEFKVWPPTGPSQMSLVPLDEQVLEMINDLESSLADGIKNLVGWLHTKATRGSFHMLGKDTVQITPHRTHACAHFSRCVSHFAQFIQRTCIGSRCLSDSLCVSPKSSHPRAISLLGVPEFSAFSLAFTSSTTTLTGNRLNPCATRLCGGPSGHLADPTLNTDT